MKCGTTVEMNKTNSVGSQTQFDVSEELSKLRRANTLLSQKVKRLEKKNTELDSMLESVNNEKNPENVLRKLFKGNEILCEVLPMVVGVVGLLRLKFFA